MTYNMHACTNEMFGELYDIGSQVEQYNAYRSKLYTYYI